MPPRPLLKCLLNHLSPLPEMGIISFITHKEDLSVMFVSHGESKQLCRRRLLGLLSRLKATNIERFFF